ncbi:ribonuclease HII [Niallia sp. XMNu-256]|uniref:ribonuclease HII n=2 Tax=Niallia sp. XMNu-256 TaxID=3082444 RepID=UPI0030D4B254
MMGLTIKEVQQQLSKIADPNDQFVQDLMLDERKGVQTLLKKWQREQEKKQLQYEKYINMTAYEKKYYSQGYQYIAGIDEVGRGPLAGPVVAAAVILPRGFYLPGIDDSKKLTEAKRELFFQKITENALAIGTGIIDNDEIDRVNIYHATKKAMLTAIEGLILQPDFLLIDAVKLDTPYSSDSLIKGDSLSVSIAAASIIAKVTRDRLLKEYDELYPGYGFGNNAGYGTKEHLDGLKKYGITPIHRKTFAPVKEYIDLSGLAGSSKTSTSRF